MFLPRPALVMHTQLSCKLTYNVLAHALIYTTPNVFLDNKRQFDNIQSILSHSKPKDQNAINKNPLHKGERERARNEATKDSYKVLW
jgi:hypothetical protein